MRRFLLLAFSTIGACGGLPAPPANVFVADTAMASDAAPEVDVATAPMADAGADVTPTTDVASDDSASPYPSGPYGSAVGQTLADLRWEGYVNEAHEDVSTELAYGPTTTAGVRATGAPFALVHLSGFL